jgi:glycosyltransferase involved in cell wall biosynthesis
MSMAEKTSVVVPTYNRATLIREAIGSVLAQGDVVGEVIVVDDGSTDETSAVLERIQDSRLRVVRQQNRGPAAARNLGLVNCTGKWVMFLDSDDALAEGAVQALVAAAVAHPCSIPTGIATLHVKELQTAPYGRLSMTRRAGWIVPEFCRMPIATIFASLFPRALLDGIGGFSEDPSVHLAEDFDLGLRLARRHTFVPINQVCYRVRMHGQNRHTHIQIEIFASLIHCLERVLGGDARYWLVRRRFASTLECCIGMEEMARGDMLAARAHFRRSLSWWPLKLSPLRLLLRTSGGGA